MIKFIRNLCLIFAVGQLINCSDLGSISPSTVSTDMFLITLNKNLTFSKVSYIGYNGSDNFTNEYFYSDKMIKVVKSSDNPSQTNYYLNSKGLADSCIYWSPSESVHSFMSKSYFTYNDSSRIIRVRQKDSGFGADTNSYTTTFEYENQNRVAMIKDTLNPNSGTSACRSDYHYTFNDQKNLLDIDNFTGGYLGKLNKNLISSASTCSNSVQRTWKYEYTLDLGGFVEKRKTINPENNEVIGITNFQYEILQ